jgi:RNA polymerase sigma factor (TIGR02999 family)
MPEEQQSRTSEQEVTDLLAYWRSGGTDAAQRLMPFVYDELRRVAHRQRGPGRNDDTLTTTALVHEAFLKLVDQTRADWRDRAHFFAVAAMAMRHILVDHARERLALKRGGERQQVDLDEDALAVEHQSQEMLDLDEALVGLARIDSRLAQVVECRFFGGLTEEETAEALGVTARTVRRDWTKAKTLLHARLNA